MADRLQKVLCAELDRLKDMETQGLVELAVEGRSSDAHGLVLCARYCDGL